MSEYKLRPGTALDAQAVRESFFAALAEHGFARIEANLNAEVALFGMNGPEADELVAMHGEEIVGFVILLPAGKGVAELSKLFVARDHRESGVGTKLLAHVIELARARGAQRLVLQTNRAFESACAYYERHGWTRLSSDAEGGISYARSLEPNEPSSWLRGVLSLITRLEDTRQRLTRELDRDTDRGGVRSRAPSRRPQ